MNLEGLGEAIEAGFKILLALLIIQMPFTVLGVWVSGCWLCSFIAQHVH